ncbi:hypothetical protein LV716_16785 [Flagellimonas sp. HMM57]|uniref:hypothetical protein n=1 Tax=unclassified Flagellimonas TaxID=2644544 RepID=UPI001F0A40CE|nr:MULTISPECIES: hypothetical protein [unclassified Flagellimonas]UII75898.1 hypothetical protein LV716_16785 [Flagellimonas sp. HMM57]
MKKATLLVTVLIQFGLNAQWTDNGTSITTNDNVGIGIDNPNAPLEAQDEIRVRLATISITKNVVGIVPLGYSSPTGAMNWSLRGVYQYSNGVDNNTDGGDLDIIKSLDRNTILATKTDGTPLGNVGVGITNPNASLEVQDEIQVRLATNFITKNVARIIPLGYSGPTGAMNWSLRGVYQYSNGVTTNTDGGDLDIIKSLDRNTILATKTDGTSLGNVGIGTINPDAKLAVNGNIHTKEVKVDLVGWPDYVFEKEYNLPTLEEVEAHITEKGHLQDIPSAKEVEENGIKLGEMNAKLLQKIEELMLYTIQQQKEIEELKQEISGSKKQKS